MSGLFDFLTVANLLIFLLCIIGLYYSINLVIYYYAPTSTPFVNMYFLYYIFFIMTLLISVACNNYIEMTDSDIDISDISTTMSLTEPVTTAVAAGLSGAESSSGAEGPIGATEGPIGAT
jgi:hypothetical protein